MPRLNPALLGMAALIAVIFFSDPGQDAIVDQATAADVQDAIKTAQRVAVAQAKGIEE